ncbi:MAG: DEAD/DEAH box helicase family protein, partial [bacterium]
MSEQIPSGLYDLLLTEELREKIKELGLCDLTEFENLSEEELINRYSVLLSRVISKFLTDILFSNSKEEIIYNKIRGIFNNSDALSNLLMKTIPFEKKCVREIRDRKDCKKSIYPDTPLGVSALLTGSSRTPALKNQIIKELKNCERADWLVSFIKFSGLRPILNELKTFTSIPTKNGLPKLRIATTSYMGATDLKAIEELLKLPNTEIKISYDTKRTRLHAKAYIFYRDTGFGSAYVGSANLSKSAIDEGLEWTAKISQYETKHLWDHIIANFESHWEDEDEFTRCCAKDLHVLKNAIAKEKNNNIETPEEYFFIFRPFNFQEKILQEIDAERKTGKDKHLIIAATGTGKTMIAAFDYKRYCDNKNIRVKLLFIAHREELLKQARIAFRHVLKDGSFGEIVSGSNSIITGNHLFCTVQSWNSKRLNKFSPDFFEYVVLDEAHHASAKSYQCLINHVKSDSLLGLTATPERMDGKDIRDDFGGCYTHEMRLTEAIERVLLAPFHFYGIPDLE